MNQEAFLVIDAGSGSVKSFLISPMGMINDRSEREWNRDNWRSDDAWAKISDSVSVLMNRNQTRILGVSCTGMREEFILLDEEGKQVHYELSEDSEKHGYRILEEYGKSMYERSGHWPVPNWIAGAILPWLQDQESILFEKVTSILMMSDWVNYKLTCEHATEGSSACETSLYDIRENGWDWQLIHKMGLPKSIFPEVKRNGEIIGTVQDEVSEVIGVSEGIPVVMGGADTQCGLLGMGTACGETGAIGGTTTPVQIVVDDPLFDSKMRTWSNNYLFDNSWILESNVGYTGRTVRWIRDELIREKIHYDELNLLVSKAPLGSNGVLSYLGPHLFDNSPPYWSMDKLGNLPVEPTITGNHSFDISSLLRSVFEANCYGVKANLVQLQDISGLEFDFLRFCGGNSKSDLWMQIQADVLGIKIKVPRVYDATAIGTAILVGLGIGYFDNVDEAVSNMVKTGKVYEPRKIESEVYQLHYKKWMDNRERLGRT